MEGKKADTWVGIHLARSRSREASLVELEQNWAGGRQKAGEVVNSL